jgi:GT2 family glycosyltransferase
MGKYSFSAFWRKARRISARGFKKEYDLWIKHHQLSKKDIEQIKEQIRTFKYQPKISIVMPVYNVEEIWLEKAVQSVLDQIYENWELCVVDDASSKKHIKAFLSQYQHNENIKIKFLDENKGTAAASNIGLALAQGEYVSFLDHDDEISRDALFEVVKLLNQHPEADLIYSDEDKIDANQKRVQPFFKPDYSPDWLLSFNYICHFLTCRKKLLEEVKGFRKEFEGSQDYDLVLRLTEKTDQIHHIPRVLYHWRQIKGSTSIDHKEKIPHIENSIKALNQALERRNIEGTVEKGINFDQFENYRVKRKIKNHPMVSIIIPVQERVSSLQRCVQSIRDKTDYQNYEIILIGPKGKKNKSQDFLSDLRSEENVQVIDHHGEDNLSQLNNLAVIQAKGSHVLFLSRDIEVVSQQWLTSMLEHSQRREVGAVGAKLIYPDHTIQHAGVIIGLAGAAGYSHEKFPEKSNGYFGSLNVIRNCSAITAACMMMRKQVFNQVGGFDEEHLPFGFSDVDLCLELRKKGYLVVYTPCAVLVHYEMNNRLNNLSPDEMRFINRKWGDDLLSDPYYSPNLSLGKESFRIKTD